MNLPHWLLGHDWQTEAAVRHCDHAWTGPDLGRNVIPATPLERGAMRRGPHHCEVDLYQACIREGCEARRRRRVTQRTPPPRDLWIDDAELPTAVPTEGR